MLTYWSFIIYLILIPIVGLALVLINSLLMSYDSYWEKTAPFECGFLSFSQSRSAFSVSFILISILFLPFDLEVSSILPYAIVLELSSVYAYYIILIFILILVLGFVYEITHKAIKITVNFKYGKSSRYTLIEDLPVKK